MTYDLRSKAYDAETKYGIPNDLYFNLLTKGEKSGATAVSPKGAIGYAQLLPGTAKELGVDPWDPDQNVDGGGHYLRKMYDMFGDWRLATAAYNAGPGNVQKHKGVPNFPETMAYQSRIWGDQMPGTTPASPAPDAGTQKALSDYEKALPEYEKRMSDIDKELQSTHDQMQKVAATPLPERPKPPTIRDLPEPTDPKDYIKDPTRVLGQVLPGLAILSSLKGRRSAINAMGAAGAAMKAARERDQEAFERAHEQWKDKMQETLAENDQDRQKYLDIMEDRRMSLQEKTAELQTWATVSGNAQAQALIQQGKLGELYKYIQTRDQLGYRAAQVYDMSARQENDRQKLSLEQRKLELNQQKEANLVSHREAQIKVAIQKNDRPSIDKMIAELSTERQIAADAEDEGLKASWTPAKAQQLAELEKVKQNMAYNPGGGGPSPGQPGADQQHPLPMPKSAAEAKAGMWYQTSKGVLKWNGKAFEGT